MSPVTPIIPAEHIQTNPEPFCCGGSFSDVYEGYLSVTTGIRQKVAVKLLRGTRDDLVQMKRRVQRESRVWNNLEHPNVLPFLGFCEDLRFGRPALISLYCEEGDIMVYLEKHPSTDKAPLIFQIACGLDFLHAQDVVHGDMKCSNVLIDKGRPLICDFGRSVILGQRGFTTDFASTRAYTAPELFGSADSDDEATTPKVGRESDVYAFGMTCSEILTGKQPFHYVKTPHPMAMIKTIFEGLKPEYRYSDQEYLDIWHVIEPCINKHPSERPSMTRLVNDLQSCRQL